MFLCFFTDSERILEPQDALLKAAMVAGFAPNLCLLYRGQRSPPPGCSKQQRRRCDHVTDILPVWCLFAWCDVFHSEFVSGAQEEVQGNLIFF